MSRIKMAAPKGQCKLQVNLYFF